MKGRKISILLPNLTGGGAERLSIDLAAQFIAMGVSCNFIVGRNFGALAPRASAVADIHELGTARMLDVLKSLPDVVGTVRPDAIIANLWPITSISALALRRVARVIRPRLLLTEHAVLSQQYADWGLKTRLGLRVSQMLSARLADATIGVSQGVVDDLADLSGMARSRFTVIHNPVPPPMPASSAQREEAEATWGPRGGRRILTVGNLKRVKNHQLLIDAFARFREPGDRLIILGEGDQRAVLENQIAELGLGDCAALPGFREHPAAYYNSADLFVLTSHAEGFGNVLVEAMHAGLPVISTQCPGGPAVILDNGAWGALVPAGDADALARAMRESVQHPVPAESLKQRAAQFSVEKAADAYLRLAFPDAAASFAGPAAGPQRGRQS